MVDRVATTGLVWMGLTTGCAQCHSHKYDAISHTDYYRLMALLNNADEPEIPVKTDEWIARSHTIQARIDKLTSDLNDAFPPAAGSEPLETRRKKNLDQHFKHWLDETTKSATLWTPIRPQSYKSNLPRLELLEDASVFSSGDITKRDSFRLMFDMNEIEGNVTAIRLEVLPDERLPAGGPGRAYYEGRKGDFFLSEFTATQNGKPLKFSSASQSYGKISIGSGSAAAKNVIDGNGSTGWSTAGREGEPHQLVLNLAKPISAAAGLKVELLFERHFAASLGRFRLSVTTTKTPPVATSLPNTIERLLSVGSTEWNAEERTQVLNYFLSVTPKLADQRKEIEKLRSQLPSYPTTLVFQERPADHPRETHRHHRGEYLQPKEEVSPGVPALFPPLPKGQPANRLTFARWLVSDRNPMASRLVVNRAWRSFFGEGLVRTNGDYGIQSEPPIHPELLDWLSCEFMENGWSLKSLHKQIVLSATYRQSSSQTDASQSRDPENYWLSCAPRYRVDAEVVRDLLLK
ncbi:MAG: DUF1553 domain-containing protein, partial [Planctomycetaceae bacterium]|nr:DUF1553 domain-containing protein [Planctomycetaceae bacterium]